MNPRLFPELEPELPPPAPAPPRDLTRRELLKTFTARQGAYAGPRYGPDHPYYRAYWDYAIKAREACGKPVENLWTQIADPVLRQYAMDGWRFGALTRPLTFAQGATRTRSGRLATQEIAARAITAPKR